MRVIALLPLFAAACAPSVDVEGHDSAIVCTIEDCAAWTPEAVGAVLDDFVLRWKALFGETPAVPRVIVVEADVLDRGGAQGDEVHVDVNGGPQDWPLVHEATHNALRAKTGNGDPDHAEGSGPWTEAHSLLVRTAWEN